MCNFAPDFVMSTLSNVNNREGEMYPSGIRFISAALPKMSKNGVSVRYALNVNNQSEFWY